MDKATLLSYMPKYYKKSKVVENINNANSIELTTLDGKIEDVLNQFFLLDADSSIERWEKEFGIKIVKTQSLEERRNRVLAKLRGQGTSTVQTIKNMALSYVENADVIENNSDYSFMVSLTSHNGFPYELKGLYETIDELKPAHLQANYASTSITNDSITTRAVSISGEEIRVLPYRILNIESTGKVKFALGQSSGAEIISINPKEE